ncbi:ATP-binding cassette domain-containing protein [Micromonospora sp. WMMD967]|uniref:ABC transporter ATP-binding protein n=1 Tax=Micromonospora sp. WMMD967 TaxID=3016101 RepID=UPI0024159A64|nr:ATP-binding cassette domain-containing protein [Micromonospora sp. WMMD967]MDG4838458.1 ATP-binding cassette domain-containing protein [Micromonospora sp. WMMD967]
MEIVLDALAQGYRGKQVFEGLNLTLRPGVTALLGPNGAGKTTLIRTLATVLPPRSGRLSFGDLHIVDERSARVARNEIGYLPQDFGYDPQMTVEDFVTYAAWLRGVGRRSRQEAVIDALELVDLSDMRRTKMRKLSGGMRRRAGIAWATVGRPRLALLDEPTVGLDPRQRLQFRKVISNLAGTVVVLSTHLIHDVQAICDRVIVLHNGASQFDGTVSDLEALGSADFPGHSALEKAYMSLLPEEERQL